MDCKENNQLIYFKNLAMAGNIAQLQAWRYKFCHQHSDKNPGVLAQAWNPNTGEGRQVDLCLLSTQLSLFNKFKANVGAYLKTRWVPPKKQDSRLTSSLQCM